MVMNRHNFDYTFKDGIKYYLWKVRHFRGCPCRSSKSIKLLNVPTRDIKLRKAKSRLIDELDIIRLISTIRSIRETQKAIFSERELLLLQLQRQQVISSTEDSSGSEYDYFDAKGAIRNVSDSKAKETKEEGQCDKKKCKDCTFETKDEFRKRFKDIL